MANFSQASGFLMDHTKKSTYFYPIDALRVFSILAVILIHTTTKTLANLDHNVVDGAFSLFLNQMARFAVPMFFLISGFVLELNNREVPYTTYFKKRISRVATPFLFWSLLYFLLGNSMDIKKIFSYEFLNIFINGKASYHLYFIPTLVIFYFTFPLLHRTLNFLKKLWVIALIWVIQIILLAIDYYIKPLEINQTLRIAILVFAMFVTGMTASHYKEMILEYAKKYLFLISTVTLVLLGIIFFHVIELTTLRKTTTFIYNQHGPLNYVYTLLLSIAGVYFFERKRGLELFFIKFSKLSFFVFFIHVLILDYFWNLFVRPQIPHDSLKQVWFDPMFFAVITLLSFSIAYIVHKIPYASKITG